MELLLDETALQNISVIKVKDNNLLLSVIMAPSKMTRIANNNFSFSLTVAVKSFILPIDMEPEGTTGSVSKYSYINDFIKKQES